MTNPRLPEHFHSVRDIAAYLGVSVPTVYRLIRSRKLKAVKVGGQWRVSETAIRQFLEEGIKV